MDTPRMDIPREALDELKNIRFRSQTEMNVAKRILDLRYEHCDTKGHLGPNKEGRCQHCYRHYEYRSKIGGVIAQQRRNLPTLLKPVDGADIERQERQDIELQKVMDRSYGLREIAERYALIEEPKPKKGLFARLFS